MSDGLDDGAVGPATAVATPERSPRRGMAAAVLTLEAITLGLTTPVMITIADVDTGTALAVGLGLALVCLFLAGALRAEWAYKIGYVVQVAAVALGFVVPVMFGLGLIFAALWAGADLLGRKIEREKAAAWAAYRAEQAAQSADGDQPE
jgi:hypothetical protein